MVTANIFDGFFKGKKILITGNTGFKGSWITLLLHKLGAELYGYSLEPPTKSNLYSITRSNEIIHTQIGDIRNYERLYDFIKDNSPEIIIHMAAQPLVRESFEDPVNTYTTNVIGTLHVLEAARNIPCIKVVLNVTTDKCYSNKEWFWGYREDEALGGYDPYSNSKACSELITASYRNSFFNPLYYSKHGVALASARAGNVIGGGDWAKDRLIPDFIRAISNNKKVQIRNPKAIRPWQHVLEPITGYLTLCAKLYQQGTQYADAWNFGPDDSDAKTVEWLVQTICKYWGDGAGYEIDNSSHMHESNYLKLDCSKAKTLLNWHPKWSINEALEKTIDWTKAYLEKKDMREICFQQIENYFFSNKI
jgi:CDP-glucose 4,6-dehydratase